ncbi:hypothetical protein M2254_001802 [Chryseobacterium sp. BIGb0186]|nr:hypothetical protein [Chryseobacterium sp. JUb44]MDH6210218.1 hypothetical protein [Chryseobacterium sp. BIGb0186]
MYLFRDLAGYLLFTIINSYHTQYYCNGKTALKTQSNLQSCYDHKLLRSNLFLESFIILYTSILHIKV